MGDKPPSPAAGKDRDAPSHRGSLSSPGMDPLLDAPLKRGNSGVNSKRLTSARASLQSVAVLAKALCPGGPLDRHCPKDDRGGPGVLTNWRRVIRLFADEVARKRVRFTSRDGVVPPRGTWVIGGQAGQAGSYAPTHVVIDGRRITIPTSREDLHRTITTAAWIVLKGEPPVCDMAAARVLCDMLAKLMVARVRAARRRLKAEDRPVRGMSRWFDSIRTTNGLVEYDADRVGNIKPAVMTAARFVTHSKTVPPPGEELGHLSAFRASIAISRDAPFQDILAALPAGERPDRAAGEDACLIIDGYRITMSENKCSFSRSDFPDTSADEIRREGMTKYDTLMAGLRRHDDAGNITLDSFMRRIADMPDPEPHARAVKFMLRHVSGWLGSRGASAREWVAAAAAEGVPQAALESCWTVAFGKGAWEEFCTDATLSRQRYNARAVLRRSPMLDDGLLVYPALPRSTAELSWCASEEGYMVELGHMQVHWLRRPGGWSLVFQRRPKYCTTDRFASVTASVRSMGVRPGKHSSMTMDKCISSWKTRESEKEVIDIAETFGIDLEKQAIKTHIVTDSPAMVVLRRKTADGRCALEGMFIRQDVK